MRTIACGLLLAVTLGAAWLPKPPTPLEPKTVVDTYYGKKVADPYRYLENLQSPGTRAFMDRQNAYTRDVLSRLEPARERLRQRIAQLDNAGVSISNVQRVGGAYFYQRLAPGENTAKLYMRAAAPGSPQRLLVDPDLLAKGSGKHYTIDYFLPSLDGAYVGYGISAGGSEQAVIHVVRTATGKALPDTIDRAKFVGLTSWRPDGSFYYFRLPELPEGAPHTQDEQRGIVYLHVLGQDSARDTPVLGYGLDPAVPIAPDDFSMVVLSPVSPYALGVVEHGVKNELTIYAAPTKTLNSPHPPWKKIVDVEDEVTGYDFRGSTLYLLTHKNAPSFQVVSLRFDEPGFSHARTIVPASSVVVEQISVAGDGLYVLSRNGGFGSVTRLSASPDGTIAASQAMVLRLPYAGSVAAIATDPRVAGVTFPLTSWTRSALYYAADGQGNVRNSELKQPSPVDASAYTSAEVQARSKDGTLIPLSLVYPRNLTLDGSHPAYLEGYGSYGIELNPYFSTTRIAWLERGGVYAVCHVRGGGWFGEAWHRAGMLTTKEHTIEDFIACGHYLVEKGYTSPQHLAGEGTSAGGIAIGGAIARAPHLFAAALDVVGVSNALRSEFSPNGPANIPEFGSVTTPQGFAGLYAMDAYQHLRDGVAYPAVMSVTGINDPRVPPWELAKFTARLQAASTSGRPVLLRVDYDGGHGFLAASRAQSEDLLTDEYSFLLWQLGDPAFQTIPQRRGG